MAVEGTGRAEARANGSGTADRRFVGSLLHGLTILEMFGRERRTIGIGEMAAHLGLHKSSASRLAATLAYAGFLVPDRMPGEYRLGRKLAGIAQLATDDTDLVPAVLPFLQWLTWSTGETGHLAILDGPAVRTIAVTDGWHTVRMHSWVGKTAPAYGSSMGKTLLAGLASEALRGLYPEPLERFTDRTVRTVGELADSLEVLRRNGYSYDDEELEAGLRCVGAPIAGRDGDVVASISVSGPTQRLTGERIGPLAAHVRWAAARASVHLGSAPVPAGWAAAPVTEPDPLPWITNERPAPVLP